MFASDGNCAKTARAKRSAWRDQQVVVTREEWSRCTISFFQNGVEDEILYLFVQPRQCGYRFFRHLDWGRHTIFQSYIFYLDFNIPRRRPFWRWHSGVKTVLQNNWFGASQMSVYKLGYLLECNRFWTENLYEAWQWSSWNEENSITRSLSAASHQHGSSCGLSCPVILGAWCNSTMFEQHRVGSLLWFLKHELRPNEVVVNRGEHAK